MTDHPADFVLVVDDDPTLRRLIEEALAFEGYRIEAAGTTAEALATVDAGPPHVIVLDMKMPDDGSRFQSELKRRSLNAPIVAMSASREGPRWAAQIGAHAFLAKPFDVDDLTAAVDSAFAANGGRRPPE
ncbi:MAG TPA: response regulator [Candidatus Limnocylindria bacterium]|nr:response regulator [Candidatus Limnocylindria bacterium]